MKVRFILSLLLILINLTLYSQEVIKAENFSMESLDNAHMELIDFKGQVVYISFWASWCGPCISNFEKYKEIRKSLEQEGVILLNVSIDEDDDKWKKAIEKLAINGVHAKANKKDLYPQYQISSIPLYEIVGKEGQFLYLSDEPNRNIIQQFQTWLRD